MKLASLTPTTVSPAGRRFALALLAVVCGFGFIDRVVIALVAQDLKAAFGISDFQIGLLGGTAFAVVNAAASIPLARFAERRSRALVTSLAVLIGSVSTALCAAAANFALLVTCRLGMAVGSAGTEAPPHSMISDMYEPARRASALSLYMLGVPIASIAASYAGTEIAHVAGWRATFLTFGVLGVIISVVGILLLPEPKRAVAHAGVGGPAEGGMTILQVVAELWRRPYFRYVLYGTSLVSLGSFGVNTFMPSFLARNFELEGGQVGLVFGLISGIASFVGTLMGGYVSEHLAKRNPGWLIAFPGAGLIIGAPILLFGVTRPDLALAAPIILIGSCFFYTAMGPVITITHGLLDSRSRATGSAVFLALVHMVGQGVGPPLAGFASDTLAAMSYAPGDYLKACAGAVGQIPGSACASASASGIRSAIASFAFVYVLSGLSYLLAARLGAGAARPAAEPAVEAPLV